MMSGLKDGLIYFLMAIGVIYIIAICIIILPFLIFIIAIGEILEKIKQDHIRRVLARGGGCDS